MLASRCRELTAQKNGFTTKLTALISVRRQRAHRDPRVRGADRGEEDPGGTAGMGRFRSKDAYARYNGTAPQAQACTDDRRGRRGADRVAHRVTQESYRRTPFCWCRCPGGDRTGRAGDLTAAGVSLPVR
jgi:hypothetical protein